MTPKGWLMPKAKEFNGIRFPSLEYHKEKNLAAIRGAHPACQPPHALRLNMCE